MDQAVVVRLGLQRPVPVDQPVLEVGLGDRRDRLGEGQRPAHASLAEHLQVAEVTLPLPGGHVDDLADVLLADVNEPRRRLQRVASPRGRTKPSPLTQPSGHRWPAASTIFLKPSARARFWESLPALKVSDW